MRPLLQRLLRRVIQTIPIVYLQLVGVSAACLADTLSEDNQLAALSLLHDVQNGWHNLDTIERRGLAFSSGFAKRDGANLDLTFLDGSQRTYEDQDRCEESASVEKCHHFYLLVYLPTRNAFLVYETFYEDGQYLLVDNRNGRETELWGLPRFGPDGERFFVATEEYGTDRTELQMWRRQADGAVLEWRHNPDEEPIPSYAEVVRWQKPRELLLWLWEDEKYSLGLPARNWSAMLRHDGSAWRLEQDMPEGEE
jgi:hypothetical protein